MLKELIIDNLGLLKHVHLSLEDNMTCITGETGAGKSIILNSIRLAMGERCEASLLDLISQSNKTYSKDSSITARFTVNKKSLAYNWLLENNFIETDNSNTVDITINRTLIYNKNLKSKNSINNINVSLTQLKQLANYLLYIHGQHEHLNLLKEANQLKILDTFGQINPLLKEVNNLYSQWSKIKTSLDKKILSQNQAAQKKQLLEFQLSELETANLMPNEWDEITKQHEWLANQQEYITQLNLVSNIIDNSNIDNNSFNEEYNNACINDQLNKVITILSNINNSDNNSINKISEIINQALINIEEASLELESFLSNLDTDPEALDKLDQRMSYLHELSRKYKTTPAHLYDLYIQYSDELNNFNNIDQDILSLQQELTSLEKLYFTKAQSLSEQRISAAQKLSQELTKLLKKLRMENAQVDIQLVKLYSDQQTKIPNINGQEYCVFYIKTNKEQNLHPLAQGTSGGELSRLALATQVATAQVEGTPSLIFDEVDVGLGGGTAEIVGQLLKKMGNSTQVLCITHLAQVAAQAQQHIRVSKSLVNNSTVSKVELLSVQERTQELARMIGGLKITEQTVAHAKELLELAQA